jgi:two-component system chemotaxis response regulator CheY
MADILVIDDNDAVRSLMAQMLASAGHAVEEARNGVEGIAKFHARPPALVIADLFMPQKEGIETIRELRAHSPTLPIIAVSGDIRSAGFFLKAAMALGATAALEKPFAKSDLLATVARCLVANDGAATPLPD